MEFVNVLPGFRPLLRDVALRTVCVAAGFTAFYLLDWNFAITRTIYTMEHLLAPLCRAAPFPEGPAMTCNGQLIPFTKWCTYLDLFLATAPFVCRVDQRVSVNMIRVAVAFSVIWAINSIRLLGSLSAYAHGRSWFLSHDLPDLFLYWPILGIVLFLYGRDLTKIYLGSAAQRADI